MEKEIVKAKLLSFIDNPYADQRTVANLLKKLEFADSSQWSEEEIRLYNKLRSSP